MVNRNISVPNTYRLYDQNNQFITEIAIETPDYEVVDLFKLGDRYYIRTGGNWKLREVKCFELPREEIS